ncbi:MAG: PAS domain S-box protein [Pseudomonadales bacterium]|nr:PAS domain S-box protein [Pseudomonadales bacterium]
MKNNKSKISAETLLAILDQQDCGLIQVDKQGLITHINATAQKLTGWPEEEALSEHINTVYNASADDRSLVQSVLETSEASAPLAPQKLIALSGKKYIIKHSVTPLFDDSSLNGALLSFRDVSKRYELEERLRSSHNTQQSIIDNYPLPIGIKDLNGKLVVANEACAKFFGRSIEKLIGQLSANLYSDTNNTLHVEKDRKVLETTSAIRYEFKILKEGNLDQVNTQKCTITKFPLFDSDGNVHNIGFIFNKLVNEASEAAASLKETNLEAEINLTQSPHVALKNTPRIMVVDDDTQMRELTKEILEISGFDVICPKSTKQALELMKTEDNISLLITDIMMPEMDGYQLAEQALKIKPDLKILLASGFNSYLPETSSLKSLPFINKPYSSQQLIDLVCSLLDKN